MWPQFRRFFSLLYYSLPVQLLIELLRDTKVLVLFWLLLYLILTGVLLEAFGGAYVLLEPEFNDEVGPTSMFLMGVAVGVFSLAYQLTTYILNGHTFYFIVLEKYPFLRFSLNNMALPILFWVIYSIEFVALRHAGDSFSLGHTLLLLGCMIAGGLAVSTVFGLYFSVTNTDKVRTLGGQMVKDLTNRRAQLRQVRENLGITRRVDVFLVAPWRLRPVPDTLTVSFKDLVRRLDQHHANAFVVQVMLLILLSLLYFFQDSPGFSLPAGVSILLMVSFFIMAVGAITYWFRKLGPLVWLGVLAVLLVLNSSELFIGKYLAYGLNYTKAPVSVSVEEIDALVTPADVRQDSLRTLQRLEAWAANYRATHNGQKPWLIGVMVSGGGNRSAYWALLCLQKLGTTTQDALWQQTVWVTGASGGMMGASYYRELQLMAAEGNTTGFRSAAADATATHGVVSPNDSRYAARIARDLLNPIVFSSVANLLFPNPTFQFNDRRYVMERGYAFERQLVRNCDAFQDKLLQDYAAPEQAGQTPQLIFTPTIVNTGQQLYIAPTPLRYLMQGRAFNTVYQNERPGLDFQTLFRDHGADSLRFTTAIRMSASFPYVLPNVELPTSPRLEVTDAGVADNYGVHTQAKLLLMFREWIEANTAGVLLLQLRDTRQQENLAATDPPSLLKRLVPTVGSLYESVSENKDLLNDETLDHLARQFTRVPFQVAQLQYIPDAPFQEAALNFHLTQQEKASIRGALQNPANQASLQYIQRLLAPAFLPEN